MNYPGNYMEEKNIDNEFEFVPVSIESFFDEDERQDFIKTGITVLTKHQKELVRKLVDALLESAPDRVERLQLRLHDIEQLAMSIAQFPSLLERTYMTSSVRTPEALVETLVSHQKEGDTTLHMPSKAILGKGFLVSKIHTFYSMSKLAKNYAMMSDKDVKAYQDETVTLMFTLMAEDVYMSLIRDKSIDIELRKNIARALIVLWEHRSDQTIADIAPVLQEVWSARRTLAPAFGTMMGTSELIMVSMQMDEQWTAFIKEKLSDPDVTQAMEEFLFGISHEQILKLKGILKNQGIKSIGRDEVSKYLEERVKTDISLDYRDFYLLYTVRRDNARARQRLNVPGPKKTLEDHFIRFVMEQQTK